MPCTQKKRECGKRKTFATQYILFSSWESVESGSLRKRAEVRYFGVVICKYSVQTTTSCVCMLESILERIEKSRGGNRERWLEILVLRPPLRARCECFSYSPEMALRELLCSNLGSNL